LGGEEWDYASFLVRKEAKERPFMLTAANVLYRVFRLFITIFIIVNLGLFLMYSPDKYFY